jgi:prepilin-type N-terminal cleavage/methylation domain-containing protein
VKKISLKNSKGFTLIELLVVIAIIGVLSSIVLASLSSARDKGNIAAGLDFEDHNYQTLGADEVANYPFGSLTAGNFLDTSSNRANLSPQGGSFTLSSIAPSGRNKSFVALPGAAVWGESPTLSSSAGNFQNMTLGAWVYLTNTSCVIGVCVVASADNVASGIMSLMMWWDGSDMNCYSDSIGTYASAQGLQPGKWYYVSCSLQITAANTAEINEYVNGKLIQSTGSAGYTFYPVDHVSVNNDAADLFGGISGYIDDVTLYQHSVGGS